jgi:tetratricopeptide (TPR) repeat protein
MIVQQPKTEENLPLLQPEGQIGDQCHNDQDEGRKWHERGLDLYRAGALSRAAEAFCRALEIRENAVLWNDAGTCLFALKEFANAERAYKKALELEPGHKRATANLSALYVLSLQGRDKGAAPAPKTADELVRALQQIPPYDPKMPADFREAFSKPRSNSEYFVLRGFELLQFLAAGEREEALCRLEFLAQSDHRVGVVLAVDHIAAADWEAALRLLWAAWELHPSDLFTERLLIYCEHKRHESNPSVADPFSGLDDYLKTHFCDRPWKQLEFTTTGDAYCCCPGWLPVPIGDAQTFSTQQTRESRVLEAIRKSIHDGSYTYCSKINCPQIAGRNLSPRNPELVQLGPQNTPNDGSSAAETTYPLHLEKYPSELVLTYDRSCNLACPSCRTDFYMAGPEDRTGMEAKYERYILEMAEHARLVFLEGAGEVFSSRHSRKILGLLTRSQYPRLQIRIISNGVLFDRNAWETFDLKDRVEAIFISVDAAREETYKIVRRGGDYKRLLRNLTFLKSLRENENQQFRWELHFVVSKRNYREMPEFVQLSKDLGVDWVVFSMQRNWGHVSAAEMKELAVFNTDHPEHGEFREIMMSPELADPIVYPGVLTAYQNQPMKRERQRRW